MSYRHYLQKSSNNSPTATTSSSDEMWENEHVSEDLTMGASEIDARSMDASIGVTRAGKKAGANIQREMDKAANLVRQLRNTSEGPSGLQIAKALEAQWKAYEAIMAAHKVYQEESRHRIVALETNTQEFERRTEDRLEDVETKAILMDMHKKEFEKESLDRLEDLETKVTLLTPNMIEDPNTGMIVRKESALYGDPVQDGTGDEEVPLSDDSFNFLPQCPEKQLTADSFSFLLTAPYCSKPFFLGLAVFALQITVFLLVAINMFDPEQPENPFQIPSNVTLSVRVTQFLAIFISVTFQNDLVVCLDLLKDGYTKAFQEAFKNVTPIKFTLASILRFTEGSLSLILMFALIVTSPTVIDVLLNFTAVEFVSEFDEVFFFLAKHGVLGGACALHAIVVEETTYRATNRGSWFQRRRKMFLMNFLLIALMIGYGIVIHQQNHGNFICATVFVQFGDDVNPALGALSGLYDKKVEVFEQIGPKRVEYVERRSQRAKFSYCNELGAWTFTWLEHALHSNTTIKDADPCNWAAKSFPTDTYDLTETASQTWYAQDEYKRVIILNPFHLTCADCDEFEEECTGRGTCEDAVCSCDEGWMGLQCEFTEPCKELATDVRFGGFPAPRDISTQFNLLEDEEGLVMVYARPVYVSFPEDSSSYDVIFFAGRRWVSTYASLMPEVPVHETASETKAALAAYFRTTFHALWSRFGIEFASEPRDVGTEGDANSPIGVQWFFAQLKPNARDMKGAKISSSTQTTLLCSICDGSNPCLYDGVCINGTCACSIGSDGSLCEETPVGNGRCDPFFNKPEFKMDGGDCCESSCESTGDFVCGAEEQGFVSTGFVSCTLPTDEWQEYKLDGEAGSFSGFAVDLSRRSLAVGELLQDRVLIYDLVGSSWVPRATIAGTVNSRFGTSVAISAGPYNVVRNPRYLPALTVAIQDGNRVLRIYKCNREGCSQRQQIPDFVYAFHLSDDGAVLATTVFDPNLWPPTLVRVYESINGLFEPRAEISVAQNDASLAVWSLAQSGDGSNLILHKQQILYEDGVGLISREQIFEIHSWNLTSYELETRLQYTTEFNAYSFEFSLDMSQDGTVLAYGAQICQGRSLHVFDRSKNNTWVARAAAPINETECTDTQRPYRNNNLALSKDGSVAAFRLGNDVSVFQWESLQQEWRRVGGNFPLTHYPLALSSDGKELAIGAPENGVGGVTTIFSLPGTKVCANGTSLLRLSLTLDRVPNEHYWDLRNTLTGEVIYQQGPYPLDLAFATIVEETCLDVNASCFEFSIYNTRNRGMQAPGKYALFLDNVDIGRGTLQGLFEKVSFGNCPLCPDGLVPFKMLMFTCGPLDWRFFHLIDASTQNITILKEGTTIGMATDPKVHNSCGDQRSVICDTPLRQEHETCVDPTECYGLGVTSYNRAISYLELELDGNKTTTDEVEICAGFFAAVGNECPS